MPSVSPGTSSTFDSILPGQPNAGLQSFTTLIYRWKRYYVYISGKQLNILRSPTELVQAITFNEPLVAVRAEGGDGGRMAAATAGKIWIMKTATTFGGRVNWVQELVLNHGVLYDTMRTLSWGSEGELLVGSAQALSLFDTLPSSRISSPRATTMNQPGVEERTAAWTRATASAIRFAEFSPDAGLIATCGDTDPLVKVWRRLSYEEAIFDFAYLRHEGIVTYLEWRASDAPRTTDDETHSSIRFHNPDETCEVLYIICSDGRLSIWRTNNHNDLDILSLYTQIDLVSAIPHSPVLTTNGANNCPTRYAFVIPASSYSDAVSVALKKHSGREVKHAIEHLKEVSSREPDVVVTLDTQGRMSAWGLSSIGHKRRLTSNPDPVSPFHIAHSENMGLGLTDALPAAFTTWFEGDVLNIVSHRFGQLIKWWQGAVENFSSSAALDVDRGHDIAVWQGNEDFIRGMSIDHTSHRLLSWPTNNVNAWFVDDQVDLHLEKQTSTTTTVFDADSVQRGKSLLLLCSDQVELARIDADKGSVVAKHQLGVTNLHLLRIEGGHIDGDEHFLAYNDNGAFCLVFVNPTHHKWDSQEPGILVSHQSQCLPIASQDNKEVDFNHFAVVVHPRKAGWVRIAAIDAAGLLYRRDVSIAALAQQNSAGSESSLTFRLDLVGSKLAMTTYCAAVLAEGAREITIVELKEGYIEHRQQLEQPVQNILFPRSNPDRIAWTEHSILAISYQNSVDILVRMRYNHIHHDSTPYWTTVKSVSIGNIGLNISSIAWLDQRRLAIAAGSSIFISSNDIAVDQLSVSHRQQLEFTGDEYISIDSFTNIQQTPLTCWQPHVLRQLLLHGFFDAVVSILFQLQAKLRFYTNGDPLDALVGLEVEELLRSKKRAPHSSEDIDLSQLLDQLDEVDLPYTSKLDQERLKLVVQTISYVARYRQSLDSNAIRYLVHWRYHVLLEEHSTQSAVNGTSQDHSDHKVVPVMGWREINFAYQTTTQQPLLEILNQYYENKLDWSTVKSLGITLWLHNINATKLEGASMASVEQVFDAVGQSAYRATQPPNPADAALFLLAFRKKAVLLSLWRVAVGNREQKSTQNFLKRDFNVEENKIAARKNAYALMGKRRFQYAAAFFLLADDATSAISVLAGQCEDLHLAMSVARAYGGDGSPLVQKFILERVIQSGQKDRWLLSWAYSITAEPAQALRALVVSVDNPSTGERTSKSWQQDDPVSLTFYHELREKVARGSVSQQVGMLVTTQDEYRAVLRSARILRRMGFWLLALQLVQHWSFVQQQIDAGPSVEDGNPPKTAVESSPQSSALQAPSNGLPSLLDAFEASSTSTSISTASKSDTDDRAAKAAALLAKIRAKKDLVPSAADVERRDVEKKPTQFDEPAASSILDSFGF